MRCSIQSFDVSASYSPSFGPLFSSEGLFFCLCLETFKFHFNNARPLLAGVQAEPHVFDVAVSREPCRDSVLFRPVRKAQDAAPVAVKPTVGAGAPSYQSHSIPPDLLPWNSYDGIPSASEPLRSFSRHSEHQYDPSVGLPQV
jgi:hypothetical protein